MLDLYKRVVDGVAGLRFPDEHPSGGHLRVFRPGIRHLRRDAGLLVTVKTWIDFAAAPIFSIPLTNPLGVALSGIASCARAC